MPKDSRNAELLFAREQVASAAARPGGRTICKPASSHLGTASKRQLPSCTKAHCRPSVEFSVTQVDDSDESKTVSQHAHLGQRSPAEPAPVTKRHHVAH